jgi:hypothetical protein
MNNIYKDSGNNHRLKGLVRMSTILIMIMVWILIDKGNIYGQETSVRNVINKSEMSSASQSPMFRERADDPRIVQSEDENQFVVMPNPFTKDLVFDFEFTIKTNIPFEVIDPLGRLAQSGHFEPGISAQHLDLSHLQNGMYLVRLNMGNRMEVRRVIKK